MPQEAGDILIVEDSRMFAHAIMGKIETELGYRPFLATSFQQARQICHEKRAGFLAAVVDLVLPDAPHGEVVDHVLGKKIPTIVMTGEFSDPVREEFTSRAIVDYIVKEGPHSLDILVNTLRRLNSNKSTKILIVDDSRLSRKTIQDLLLRHQFMTFEAQSGVDALGVIANHPDIRVVITDYHMPEMDGFGLINRIRQTYTMDQMAIIGISGSGGSAMSAKFLKIGANDFIVKPFSNEEFYLRINQNLQMLDYIESVRTAAIRDHLTGLYNRRYFFDVGEKMFQSAQQEGAVLVLAMIDIDHFKRVNDTFGHAAGDEVLRHVSTLLAHPFDASAIVARLGGEEFCILAPDMALDHGAQVFNQLRLSIAEQPLATAAGSINPTISIGLATAKFNTLEETLHHADTLLYAAKTQGRNRVIIG